VADLNVHTEVLFLDIAPAAAQASDASGLRFSTT
jgi:hypothetical protein